jgi:signal transduction histidine kinase
MTGNNGLLGIETTAQQLAQKVAESLPVTIASVALWDGPSLSLTIKAIGTARPLGVPLPLWSRVPLATAPTHRAAFQQQEPVFLDLARADEVDVREEVARALVPDLQAIYLLPIRLGDETVGLLALGEMRSPVREPMSAEKRNRCRAILDEFLATSAHAWEAGRLREQIRAMASLLRMVRGTFDARTGEDILAACAAETAGWLGVPARGVLFRVAPSGDIALAARYRFPEPMTSADAAQILLAVTRSRTQPEWPVGVASVTEDPLDPLHGVVPAGARWTRITLPLMGTRELLGVICLYVEDELRLSDWELDAFRHRAEIAARVLELITTLQDNAGEREWVGRTAYETLAASHRTALREALKGIDRLVATLLPERVHRLVTELHGSPPAGGPSWTTLAEAIAREVTSVLEGLRAEDPTGTIAEWEIDLNSLVRRVAGLARSSLVVPIDRPGGSVQLSLELAKESLVARVSPELVVALVHAIQNAVEAMPDGGEIRVRTGRDNGHALISVQDNGPGVAALDDAFAPLVSTKGKPHLGLGLAVIRVVASQHGGTASLSSGKAGGALLEIRLPLSVRDLEPPREEA